MPTLFITGATGYIGSAVARVFKEHGYEVLALVRSDASVDKVTKSGYTAIRGNLGSHEQIQGTAEKADVVIHAAADYEGNVNQQDKLLVESVIGALKGSNKPFIYTSGIWVLGPTDGATEETPENPIKLVAWRVGREKEVLEAAMQGVRTIVLRPGIVYGETGGIVDQLFEIALKEKQARYINDGENKWPVVHVEDLAELYLLAAQRGSAGSLYHATNEEHVTLREVAEQISRAIGAPEKVSAWTIEEARNTLGAFADGLILDQTVDSSKARNQLGWKPLRTSVSEAIAKLPQLTGVK